MNLELAEHFEQSIFRIRVKSAKETTLKGKTHFVRSFLIPYVKFPGSWSTPASAILGWQAGRRAASQRLPGVFPTFLGKTPLLVSWALTYYCGDLSSPPGPSGGLSQTRWGAGHQTGAREGYCGSCLLGAGSGTSRRPSLGYHGTFRLRCCLNGQPRMDESLEMYNLPRLNHEEIENPNRPITSKEIKSVIKNLPRNRSPVPHRFTGDFSQTFKKL